MLACRPELARLLRGRCGLDGLFVTGQTVEFDVAPGRKGEEAQNVRVI